MLPTDTAAPDVAAAADLTPAAAPAPVYSCSTLVNARVGTQTVAQVRLLESGLAATFVRPTGPFAIELTEPEAETAALVATALADQPTLIDKLIGVLDAGELHSLCGMLEKAGYTGRYVLGAGTENEEAAEDGGGELASSGAGLGG